MKWTPWLRCSNLIIFETAFLVYKNMALRNRTVHPPPFNIAHSCTRNRFTAQIENFLSNLISLARLSENQGLD